MRYTILIALIALVACVVISPASAQDKPVQLALVNPIQIFPDHESIGGLRISLIYGKNANMTGFDWGLATSTTGTFKGVQWTFVGLVGQDFKGWQANFVGITDGAFTGLQWGFYHSAGSMNGLQLGLINVAGSMKGIQLGLVNIIKEGGFMPFFPIVNWGGL